MGNTLAPNKTKIKINTAFFKLERIVFIGKIAYFDVFVLFEFVNTLALFPMG